MANGFSSSFTSTLIEGEVERRKARAKSSETRRKIEQDVIKERRAVTREGRAAAGEKRAVAGEKRAVAAGERAERAEGRAIEAGERATKAAGRAKRAEERTILADSLAKIQREAKRFNVIAEKAQKVEDDKRDSALDVVGDHPDNLFIYNEFAADDVFDRAGFDNAIAISKENRRVAGETVEWIDPETGERKSDSKGAFKANFIDPLKKDLKIIQSFDPDRQTDFEDIAAAELVIETKYGSQYQYDSEVRVFEKELARLNSILFKPVTPAQRRTKTKQRIEGNFRIMRPATAQDVEDFMNELRNGLLSKNMISRIKARATDKTILNDVFVATGIWLKESELREFDAHK